MAVIYKITNPRGKVYIGQTTDFIRRKSNYKNLNCKSQTHLYNSIIKYGWENHILEIIEECKVSMLGRREKYWKLYYDSCNPSKGLGIRFDEERGGKLSKETKNKISKAKKGVKYSKESSLKKSQSLKGNQNALGAIRSIQTRKKISRGNKKLKPKEFGKKVSQNKERSKKISQSHIGKSHPRTQEWSNKIGSSNKKPIIQYNLEEKPIKDWNSAKDASISMGCSPSAITACCKGKQKTAYGYKWKYKNE